MEFNSSTFGCFILITGAFFYLLNRFGSNRLVNAWLLAASYLFYGCWDTRFLFLITFSTALDYTCGLLIAGHKFSIKQSILSAATLCSIAFTLVFLLPVAGEYFSQGIPAYAQFETTKNSTLAEYNHPLIIGCTLGSLIIGIIQLIGSYSPVKASRKLFLLVSIVGNLGLLAAFKYFNFFIESANQSARLLGLAELDLRLDIVVPVGISFYTFQTLSYTIDIYRERIKPTRNLLDFALFVAYFPQLVAGPIERASILLPQLEKKRLIRAFDIESGMFLILWGLFKKIFIADNLATIVSSVYDSGNPTTGVQVIFATYSFAFQIYADFSAYSDIARGISRCMGVELMVNFNAPFISKSPSEFWNRWHISLSTWLKDYLYISLGGNREGRFKTYRNLMITMTLGGLWHGASFNFLLWGIYQGAALCLYRLFSRADEKHQAPVNWKTTSAAILHWAIFFQVMTYGWLLFRCSSSSQILSLTAAILLDWSQWKDALPIAAKLIFYISPLLIIEFFQVKQKNQLAILSWPMPLKIGAFLVCFYLTMLMGEYGKVEFIYFQF